MPDPVTPFEAALIGAFVTCVALYVIFTLINLAHRYIGHWRRR